MPPLSIPGLAVCLLRDSESAAAGRTRVRAAPPHAAGHPVTPAAGQQAACFGWPIGGQQSKGCLFWLAHQGTADQGLPVLAGQGGNTTPRGAKWAGLETRAGDRSSPGVVQRVGIRVAWVTPNGRAVNVWGGH